MRSVLRQPYENNSGNLIWMLPYLYPEGDLDSGIQQLKEKGYNIRLFPEGDGITFQQKDQSLEEIYQDFSIAFPWMDIISYKDGAIPDFENDILKYQIIVMPASRISIEIAILDKDICLFPPGEFAVEKLNIMNLGRKLPTDVLRGNDLRDYITSVTEVDLSVFDHSPLIVFRDDIVYEQYMELSHQQDVMLIKRYSERADRLMNVIRFYECDFTIPELLPAKPGMWNDRYSTALVYFTKPRISYVQAREVENSTCIKGIGTDVSRKDRPGFTLLLPAPSGELVNIAWHALRMNTQILEAGTETLRFIQG